MAEDAPIAQPTSLRPRAGAVRYRSALRCAVLRRWNPRPHVIHWWSWLFPRFLYLVVLGPLMSLVTPLAGLVTWIDSGPDAPVSDVVAEPASPAGSRDEGIVVIISKSSILVGDEPAPVVSLPPREQLAAGGVDPKYKRAGPNDLFIVPLGNALARVRGSEQGDNPSIEVVVVADATTPYRLLFEVLFTLGQSGFGKYHLMVLTGKK
jgi:hypothetical protein